MGEAEEKAEKLAAAKKKYEQLKKQKAKKGGAKKKEEDKADAELDTSTSKDVEEAKEEGEALEDDEKGMIEDEADPSTRPAHARQASMSLQSQLRSESFRQHSNPLSPGAEGFQQAQRVEELEKENKRLQAEAEDAQKRWHKLEEELQDMREADGEAAGMRTKAEQADRHAAELERVKAELSSLQRQNSQLAASKRRTSTSIPASPSNNQDLLAQINSKAETISTLEIEISSLQSKLTAAQSRADEQTAKIDGLELELGKVRHSAESTSQELADLKSNLEQAGQQAEADGSARSSAETRLAQLEAELGSAKRAVEEATKRATTQEKKVETLTTLHRESDARHQAKISDLSKQERDAKELRARVTALSNDNARLLDEALRRKKMEATGDAAGLEEIEDEERQRLASRVRELEEEVFELQRGAWREKRMAMQPGMGDDPYSPGGGLGAFDDIDLSGTPNPSARRQQQPQHSSFQDIINSGLSAFRGTDNRRVSGGRKQSLGLMSEDDFSFDEDAFRKAQDDEAKNRLERVKEVKRGLVNWKGFKVDITDLRSGWGGVFEA